MERMLQVVSSLPLIGYAGRPDHHLFAYGDKSDNRVFSKTLRAVLGMVLLQMKIGSLLHTQDVVIYMWRLQDHGMAGSFSQFWENTWCRC